MIHYKYPCSASQIAAVAVRQGVLTGGLQRTVRSVQMWSTICVVCRQLVYLPTISYLIPTVGRIGAVSPSGCE